MLETSLASARDRAAEDTRAERPWLAVWTLCERELVRFIRQPNRVVGAIGQPILFWGLFGAGLGPSFRLPQPGAAGVSYVEYFFPGALVLIVLFTAIFTTISVIEDRREGFLQSVLVAPIPRWAMVLGKLAGGTLLAVAQGMLFLVLGLTIGLRFDVVQLAAIFALVTAMALGLTGLGFVIAWRMESTQGFHAIMNLLLMPLWLLSGAFFPAAGWLAWLMRANPLTYGVAGLRRLLYLNKAGQGGEAMAAYLATQPSMAICWMVTIAFAAVMFFWSCRVARMRTTGDSP